MMKDVVKVYDAEGVEHKMTYPNARDLVAHDDWTWKRGVQNARPPKVKPDAGPRLNAEFGEDAEDFATEVEDEAEDEAAEEPASESETHGIAHGLWSGLTKEQALKKAEDLGVTVDKRWNRQRIIDAITANV